MSENDGGGESPPRAEASLVRLPGGMRSTSAPSPIDVLLGRGKSNVDHPGNRRFQVIIEMHMRRYSASDTRQEKNLIMKEIVAIVKTTGSRFVKYDTDTDGWTEVNEDHARTKVGQAIRNHRRRESIPQTTASLSKQRRTLSLPVPVPEAGGWRTPEPLLSDAEILGALGYPPVPVPPHGQSERGDEYTEWATPLSFRPLLSSDAEVESSPVEESLLPFEDYEAWTYDGNPSDGAEARTKCKLEAA
jgi:hypothetical protein